MDTGYPDMDFNIPAKSNPLVFGPNYKPFPADLKECEEFLKKMELKDESICQEAHRLVNGERDQTYGTALSNFTRIAKLWSVVLGIDVTPEQVGLCMTLLKIAREVNKHKRDNLVDACGYLLCTQKVVDEKAKK